MGSCNQGMSTKCGIHGKCSCCTTQERRKHDCSIGGYDTCAQPMICKMDKLLSQVCYVCMFTVFLSRWSKMIGYDNLICNVVWCYGTCLQASLLSFSLKVYSLFFVGPLMRNAQTKIAIVYMREQSCDTRDDMMIPIWYGMYAMEGWITNVHK